MKKNNIPTLIFSAVFCLLVAAIVIYPNEAFASARDGLMLWFNVVLPSLLPFFICAEIMIGLGIVSFFGAVFKPLFRPVFKVPGEGSFNFFMSIASGYPVGSRITTKLRQEKLCTRIEGQRLLSLCSTSGPLFIIGAVATGILNAPVIGLLLAAAHYLSAVTIGFFIRFYGKEASQDRRSAYSDPITEMLDYRSKDGRPIGQLIGDSVKNGINLILMIGGFIILFSVVTRMLKISGVLGFMAMALSKAVPIKAFNPDMAASFLIGFLEVTNGIKECAALQVSLVYKVVMASFMIGFGGLSVNAQVMSIISESDLRFDVYFLFKLLQGFFAAAYSYLLTVFFSEFPVFKAYGHAASPIWYPVAAGNWRYFLLNSSVYLILVLSFMLIVSFMSIKKRLMILKPFR